MGTFSLPLRRLFWFWRCINKFFTSNLLWFAWFGLLLFISSSKNKMYKFNINHIVNVHDIYHIHMASHKSLLTSINPHIISHTFTSFLMFLDVSLTIRFIFSQLCNYLAIKGYCVSEILREYLLDARYFSPLTWVQIQHLD